MRNSSEYLGSQLANFLKNKSLGLAFFWTVPYYDNINLGWKMLLFGEYVPLLPTNQLHLAVDWLNCYYLLLLKLQSNCLHITKTPSFQMFKCISLYLFRRVLVNYTGQGWTIRQIDTQTHTHTHSYHFIMGCPQKELTCF